METKTIRERVLFRLQSKFILPKLENMRHFVHAISSINQDFRKALPEDDLMTGPIAASGKTGRLRMASFAALPTRAANDNDVTRAGMSESETPVTAFVHLWDFYVQPPPTEADVVISSYWGAQQEGSGAKAYANKTIRDAASKVTDEWKLRRSDRNYLRVDFDEGKTGCWFAAKALGKAYVDLYPSRDDLADGVFLCIPTWKVVGVNQRGASVREYQFHLWGSRYLQQCAVSLQGGSPDNAYDALD